jgi:nucleoid-associated protein YgaU
VLLGVHVVKDGDSQQSDAPRTYGDPNRWRLIAEANGVDNPLHLRRGMSLNLPRLD